MFTALDDDIFLVPESIIAGVLDADWADDPTADLEFDAPSYDDAIERH